jgi:hypothetical protein
MGRALKWLGIAAGALAVLLAAGVALTVWSIEQPRRERCRGRERFDALAWHAGSVRAVDPRGVRGCMVDDLLARHDLRGWPRARVTDLLGAPDSTGYFRQYDLVYWLGPERGAISIDSEWLVLKLDGAGRVAEYRLITD